MALNKRTLLLAAAIAGAAVIVLFLAQDPGNSAQQEDGVPVMSDKGLRVELVAEGLSFPTGMRFLGDDIFVLQKEGQVRLVSQGKLYEKPLLQLDVASGAEQGLLGITAWQDSVLLYFTASDAGELKNRIFKYDYDRSEKVLANGTRVLDLPGEPGPFHNGGKIAIGPDGYLYAVIGDTNAGGGMLDNEASGREPDDKSVILRVDRETGEAVEGSPFYGDKKLARYYAYGIRNSFGMDFDPVSGRLWMTENGPDKYDEINVVTPGFNSGWHKVTGPIARSNATVSDLVMFNGSSYGDPAFSWQLPVGVTDIEFFESEKLGEQYENNIFVGDVNYGNLYFFRVDGDRTGLQLAEPELADLVADTELQDDGGNKLKSEAESVTVGKNFGRITDIETGPDGLLYILAYEDGKIYRVTR